MKILAIETSTDACSCALWLDGEVLSIFEITPRGHGGRILFMVEELLAKADVRLFALDALAFGCGPGSFTGLRIGTSVVQGLAFSAEIPVVPVSSLAALAQGIEAEQVIVVQDARMGEVYCGAFARDVDARVKAISKEEVCRPEKIVLPREVENGSWGIVGSAWNICESILSEILTKHKITVFSKQHPHAKEIAQLAISKYVAGKILSAEQVTPTYIRENVVTLK